MTNVLRSKQGCWTCRLRKKKCDETHPLCSTCESLTITCYGYDAKPEWMDNGEKEKAMAQNIKQVVKHTSRRKGRLASTIKQHLGQKPEAPIVTIAPKPTASSTSSGPESSVESEAAARQQPTSSESSTHDTTIFSNSHSPSGNHTYHPSTAFGGVATIPSNESMLLMHFLDNVFPLQYPMYQPGVIQGGRGWLLSLLLRTKPLYHGALALSAYHRGAVLLASRNCTSSCQSTSKSDQEKHLDICLKEFQESISRINQFVESARCDDNALGILASVVQLVFFELFAGDGDTWQIHLSAATDFLLAGHRHETPNLGLLRAKALQADLFSPTSDPELTEEVLIFRFLTGVVVWLDVVSCITTGKSPRLLALHSFLMGPELGIKLEVMTGCRNWAILQIGQVAALHEYKMQSIKSGSFDIAEFNASAARIENDVQNGLTESAIESLDISKSQATTLCNAVIPEHLIITQVFALAASAYLDLVVYGFKQPNPRLETTVTQAMLIMQGNMSGRMALGLVCPLFIIGSAANRANRELFRHGFSSGRLLDPSLDHRAKLLPLLEEIWQKRDTSCDGWTWQDVLNLLNGGLLLI